MACLEFRRVGSATVISDSWSRVTWAQNLGMVVDFWFGLGGCRRLWRVHEARRGVCDSGFVVENGQKP